jgi:hypothetical protein
VWFAKGSPRNQGSSCIVPLLVCASTRSCSASHNLVDEGLLLGYAIFIWAKSPRRGPTSAIRVACKTHPHRGVDCKFLLAYIMPRS